jgi:hypothetical protein
MLSVDRGRVTAAEGPAEHFEMDINALLSPEGSPRESATGSANPSPRKSRTSRPSAGGKRTSSGLSQEISRSPDRDVLLTSGASRTPTAPADGLHRSQAFPLHPIAEAIPGFRPLHPSTPTSEPLNRSTAVSSAHSNYAQHRPLVTNRHSSTPQMETLAGESC